MHEVRYWIFCTYMYTGYVYRFRNNLLHWVTNILWDIKLDLGQHNAGFQESYSISTYIEVLYTSRKVRADICYRYHTLLYHGRAKITQVFPFYGINYT